MEDMIYLLIAYSKQMVPVRSSMPLNSREVKGGRGGPGSSGEGLRGGEHFHTQKTFSIQACPKYKKERDRKKVSTPTLSNKGKTAGRILQINVSDV